MMLKVLVYAYAEKICLSRRVAKALQKKMDELNQRLREKLRKPEVQLPAK
jgi:hypothetical protein